MKSATLLSVLSVAGSVVSAVDLEPYRIKTAPEYVNGRKAGSALAQINTRKSGGGYVETAKELVKKVAPDAKFRVIDDHFVSTGGVGHVNFKQTANGVDIDNAVFNVNVRVVPWGRTTGDS